MDRLLPIGSPPPAWQARTLATHGTGPDVYAVAAPWSEPDLPAATLSSAKPWDPAADGQSMAHFVSHVNAECFIALLQTMDPLPDDVRARAEYKRRYQLLRKSLEVPPPPPDPRRIGFPIDPLG